MRDLSVGWVGSAMSRARGSRRGNVGTVASCALTVVGSIRTGL